MHNKIIKYALVLLATASSIFAWTEAEEITNCYKFTSSNEYNTCYTYQPGELISRNGYYNSVDELINFNDDNNNKIWTYKNYNGNYTASRFWNNNKLYFVQNGVPNYIRFILRENKYFCQVNSLDNETIMNSCGVINFQGNNNYNRDNYNTELNTIIENFNGNNASEILFTKYNTNYGNDINNVLCFKYNNLGSTYCIHSPGYVNESYGLSGNWFIQIENNGVADGTSTLQKYADMLGTSPFTAGGGNYQTPTTGTGNIPCMTIEQLLKSSPKYNTGLCYSADKVFTGGEFLPVTQAFILTLYPTYTDLRNDMNLYTNYCNYTTSTTTACQTAFEGRPKNYSLLQKIPQDVRLNDLYDYCTTWSIYSGNLQKNTCELTEEEKEEIVPSYFTTEGYNEYLKQNGIEVRQSTSGSVFERIQDNNTRDIIESRERVRTKISGIFKNTSGVEGIIPEYITRILLIIVLFAIFRK